MTLLVAARSFLSFVQELSPSPSSLLSVLDVIKKVAIPILLFSQEDAGPTQHSLNAVVAHFDWHPLLYESSHLDGGFCLDRNQSLTLCHRSPPLSSNIKTFQIILNCDNQTTALNYSVVPFKDDEKLFADLVTGLKVASEKGIDVVAFPFMLEYQNRGSIEELRQTLEFFDGIVVAPKAVGHHEYKLFPQSESLTHLFIVGVVNERDLHGMPSQAISSLSSDLKKAPRLRSLPPDPVPCHFFVRTEDLELSLQEPLKLATTYAATTIAHMKQAFPTIAPKQIRHILKTTATKTYPNKCIINSQSAIDLASRQYRSLAPRLTKRY